MHALPSRRGGTTGIILFLTASALLAAFIFAGDALRGFFGIATTPADPGSAPARTTLPDPTFAPRPPPSGITVPNDDQLTFGTFVQPEEVEDPALPAEQPDQGRGDDPQARTLLNSMDAAYQDFRWDEVQRLRHEITRLDAQSELLAQARARARQAEQMRALMSKLDSARFGLSRNIETHPNLVTIVNHTGNEVLAVPIVSMQDRTVVETDDPVGFVQRTLDAGRTVALMTTSRIPAEYDAARVVRVDPADTDSVINERRLDFDQRLRRLRESDLWDDALALFEAARFAYGNRIDDEVTNLLDRALLLNPNLAQAVKEDAAQPFFERMVRHLDQGNQTSAAGFLNTLRQNFADTSIYQQARAYYDGNALAALAAAEAARQEVLEARRREFEERRRLAREARDQETVQRLTQEEEAISERREQEEAETRAVTGDRAKADELFSQGERIYAEAIDSGNSSRRDQLYREAERWLRQSLAVYSQLVEEHPNDEGLGRAMIRCNQLVYACVKYRRGG